MFGLNSNILQEVVMEETKKTKLTDKGRIYQIPIKAMRTIISSMTSPHGRGGDNFHYKGIYRCAAGMGYTFKAM